MSALVRQVALVSEIPELSSGELTQAAAALQTQAARDFGPLWQVQATVAAFTNLNDVPLGYWPVIIEKDIQQPGAAGVHLDRHNQPYALVQYDNQWTLTASHETMEMLADPSGNRLQPGQSPKSGQGQVRFLVEVCDPCEAANYSYAINGVTVSDFITPHFYDSSQVPSIQYSFTGAVTKPVQVLPDGYITWLDPVSHHVFQLTMFGGKEQIRDLGRLRLGRGSLREIVDAVTLTPLSAPHPPMPAAGVAAVGSSALEATKARAQNLRDDIKAMKKVATADVEKYFSKD